MTGKFQMNSQKKRSPEYFELYDIIFMYNVQTLSLFAVIMPIFVHASKSCCRVSRDAKICDENPLQLLYTVARHASSRSLLVRQINCICPEKKAYSPILSPFASATKTTYTSTTHILMLAGFISSLSFETNLMQLISLTKPSIYL